MNLERRKGHGPTNIGNTDCKHRCLVTFSVVLTSNGNTPESTTFHDVVNVSHLDLLIFYTINVTTNTVCSILSKFFHTPSVFFTRNTLPSVSPPYLRRMDIWHMQVGHTRMAQNMHMPAALVSHHSALHHVRHGNTLSNLASRKLWQGCSGPRTSAKAF